MSPRRTSDQQKVRFTLWLPTTTAEQLERLKRTMGKASVAEVVREALEVYTSVRKAGERGVRLYFKNESTGEEGRIWLLPGEPPF